MHVAKNVYVCVCVCVFHFASSGELMMSLFWYYRPEHTQGGRDPSAHCEVSNQLPQSSCSFMTVFPELTLVTKSNVSR